MNIDKNYIIYGKLSKIVFKDYFRGFCQQLIAKSINIINRLYV